MRDISHKEVAAGPNTTNLRQKTLERMKENNIECKCIRCREIQSNKSENVKLNKIEYNASDGKEIFLSFDDNKNNLLLAFLRLRIDENEIVKIRELRQFLVDYVLSRSWNILQPRLFFKDLIRIAILYNMQTNLLTIEEPFRLNADFNSETGELLFTSQLVNSRFSNQACKEAGTQTKNFSSQSFKSALYNKKVRSIEWDNSAVGHFRFVLFRSKLLLNIGMNGRYHFQALSELAQRFPERAWNALSPIIDALE